jgi:heme exporter protein C
MTNRTIHWYKYASAGSLDRLAGQLIPWFAVPAGILFAIGLYLGLFVAPPDFQQGDAYRVLFVHVPAAWMGMLLYVVLAFYAAVGWVFNARVSSMMASSLSITGAMFTFLSLLTGTADLGHLVGLGREDDVDADSAVSVHRVHLPAVGD